MKEILKSYFSKLKIKGISDDSRSIKNHDAFFAITGTNDDGNNYINQAINCGASIVFTDKPILENKQRRIIYLPNIRLNLALAASIIYNNRPKNLLSVTGTNGKSSVVSYVYQILTLLGKSAASIGTEGITSSQPLTKEIDTISNIHLTTMDPINFYKVLDHLANSNVNNVIFESSSHGLDQKRLGDIKVKFAGFTSFSQDHLDYHQTMINYLNAKLSLFIDHLDINGEVVINSDILHYNDIQRFFNSSNIKYVSIGSNDNDNIKIKTQQITNEKQKITYFHNNQQYNFYTDIVGSFQVANILIAARLVENLGINFKQIQGVLHKLLSPPGRLQRVTNVKDKYHIFIDYAHTPDALQKILIELNKIKLQYGKLYIIFGCGGNRDYVKRSIMGKIATDLADVVIVTDDNPRFESPALIRSAIMSQAKDAIEIDNRENAISYVISILKQNDILLIAGKGNENYQIIGNQNYFYNDFLTVKNILKKQIN